MELLWFNFEPSEMRFHVAGVSLHQQYKYIEFSGDEIKFPFFFVSTAQIERKKKKNRYNLSWDRFSTCKKINSKWAHQLYFWQI